jgi:hypothetical protein
MAKSKEKLLQHYKHKKPTLFVQYDGFNLPNGGDYVMIPDQEGHCVMSRLTYELMSGMTDVRVLITPEASKETVIQLLRKIMDLIKENDSYRLEAKEELRKITKLKEIENEMQKISEDDYTTDDIEYLLDSVKAMLNKKIQSENGALPF